MRKLVYVLTTFLLSLSALAQQRAISGRISGTNGEPLVGASVTEKGTNTSVVTKEDGRFELNLTTESPVLVVSFVGYDTEEIQVGNESVKNVQLKQQERALSEVVVTGYQTQRKADLTGAVSVVKLGDVKNIPLGNPVKSLQGRVPGMFITTNGSPTGEATVRIRGIGTLGNNDPLYVIDGIPTKRGLQELNPNDIESMQVLKDASSATIYGSRAANGVIIITTKKAKKGYSRVDVNASVSVQNYASKLETLDADGRGRAYWQAAVYDRANPNDNQIYQFDWNGDYDNPVLNKIVYPEFIDPSQTMKAANTYWYDLISQNSIIHSYDVALSNGGEKGNSMFSLSYYDNKGIVKGSRSNKATARFNSDFNFFDGKLKIGENLSVTYMKNALIPTSDILFTALVQQPVVPVHTVDGGWGGPAPGMTDRHNPVRLIEDNRQNFSHFYRVFGNVYADYTIIPGLHLRTSYGVDYNGIYQRTLRKSYTSGFLSDPSNLAQTSQGYDGNIVWQNTINYDLKVKENRFEFLLGHEQIRFINQNFFANRQGYAIENIDYGYLDAGSSNKDNGGSGTSYSLQSFFGKVNYSFDGKYLASVTVRRDGSSRFGKEYRYGTFPAFSVGWRLSEEDFVKNIDFISDLKLRYGWGKSGNQEIANNATRSLYAAIYGIDPTWDFDRGSAYSISGGNSGQLPSGFTLIQQGNDSLKWESTTESNFGVDFGFLNNRITGSIDYFIKKTSDILISPAYLAVLGEGGNRWANGASMKNQGLEILLSYNGAIGKDLSFVITGNYSHYRNEVTYLPKGVIASYPGNGTDKTILGRPINSTFGYVADGLFNSQADVDKHAEQPGKGLGRIRYKDLNSDGVINDLDRDFIADGNPDFLYGLNVYLEYKNFDLSFFVQGVHGIDVYNDYKTYTDFSSLWVGTNWGVRTLDAWTPSNPSSTIPALTLVNRNNEGRLSTYFMENASYLKLRNLQIGYNLKNAFNLKMQNARIYLQGSNLFTIKSKEFTAPDPENPNYAFPIPVIGTIGLNLTL
jgi:TonB-linked SusC/RagA family outer membrane protein